mgnify:CR=1 FL=1
MLVPRPEVGQYSENRLNDCSERRNHGYVQRNLGKLFATCIEPPDGVYQFQACSGLCHIMGAFIEVRENLNIRSQELNVLRLEGLWLSECRPQSVPQMLMVFWGTHGILFVVVH